MSDYVAHYMYRLQDSITAKQKKPTDNEGALNMEQLGNEDKDKIQIEDKI